MPTLTVPLNLTKPTVGGDKDVWGQYWNDNADKLNAIHTNDGTGTSVGMHVGTGKVLKVDGGTSDVVLPGQLDTQTLRLRDAIDATRIVDFKADLITTATTRTLHAPDASGTLALVETVRAYAPTGTVISGYWVTAPAGFVFLRGTTIGKLGSGASERANEDCRALFTQFWALGYTPVVGGRGSSATADFDAGKLMALPDHRGRVMTCLDNAGGAVAGVLGFATYPGQPQGTQTHTLVVAEMPYHNHSGTDHLHSGTTGLAFAYANGGGYWGQTVDGGAHTVGYAALTGPADRDLTTGSTGSSGAHNNVQPTIAVLHAIAL